MWIIYLLKWYVMYHYLNCKQVIINIIDSFLPIYSSWTAEINTLFSLNSWMHWPCHFQKTAFHRTQSLPPNCSTCSFLMYPDIERAGCDIDVSFRASTPQSYSWDFDLHVIKPFSTPALIGEGLMRLHT